MEAGCYEKSSLLDENGKPKNALYASIAAKKGNSVSDHVDT